MGTKIKIISTDGHVWDAQFDPTVTVQTVKQSAVQRFYTSNPPDDFKVVFPVESRSLTDTHAIQEEKLKDNDVLLLVRRRKTVYNEVIRDSDLKAPTKEQILAVTKNLSGTVHLPPPPVETVAPTATATGATPGPSGRKGRNSDCENDEAVDFQLDLRKIIISLLSVMTTILHGDPDVAAICNEMKLKIKKRFSIAQRTNEGSPVALSPPPEVLSTPLGIVDGLIEAKKREFHPNPKAYDALKEIGFSDAEIMEALRGNKNNKDLACEWLLSENRVISDDVNTGLDSTKHLYKTLLANPAIRLGLHNPKTVLTLLEILESSSNATMWLSDPEMSPVLASVFKVYHAEKHAVPE